MLFTENSGNKFHYTEQTKFEHNYNNDPLFVKNINEYLGFSFYKCEENPVKKLETNYVYQIIQSKLDFFLKSKPFFDFKKRFYSDKINPYDNKFTHIAVHIRRPNKDDNRINGTNTPDSYYLNIINHIRQKYSNCKFHIYSQGDILKFSSYLAEDTILHLDEPLLETFNGLIFANILVTSASSFSYVAAMLSNGIIYYKRFWHPPLSNWIVC